MTTFIEHYLKPCALAHMAGVTEATDPEIADADAMRISKIVKADRATVTKQLRRFFELRR